MTLWQGQSCRNATHAITGFRNRDKDCRWQPHYTRNVFPVHAMQMQVLYPASYVRVRESESCSCPLLQVWIDSDGKVANNGARMAGLSDPRGTAGQTPSSASALLDHQWHMLTVSTQPNHVKGYRCAHTAKKSVWRAHTLPDAPVIL